MFRNANFINAVPVATNNMYFAFEDFYRKWIKKRLVDSHRGDSHNLVSVLDSIELSNNWTCRAFVVHRNVNHGNFSARRISVSRVGWAATVTRCASTALRSATLVSANVTHVTLVSGATRSVTTTARAWKPRVSVTTAGGDPTALSGAAPALVRMNMCLCKCDAYYLSVRCIAECANHDVCGFHMYFYYIW